VNTLCWIWHITLITIILEIEFWVWGGIQEDSAITYYYCVVFQFHCRHFRRVLLKSLNKDLRKELQFSQKIIKNHAKNYQIWYVHIEMHMQYHFTTL